MFCSSACLKREWMINIYTYAYIYIFIKVSSVCSENPTRSCSCAWNPHSCCSWSWASPVCALALHISGQKASVVSSLASHHLPPPPELDWTVEDEEERRVATVHTLTWSTVCCHRAVWLSASRVFPFTVFCCESSGTFWLLFVFVLFFKLLTCSCHSHDSPSPEGYQQPLWCCTLPQSDKCPRVCVWECVRTQCYLHVIRVGNER